MNKPKTIIGISGVAQSGKDTFFQLSSRYLYEEMGLSSKRYALADFLKDECEDFLKEKFDLNVYSQKIEDKEIFRPFLVWFGDIKRAQTHGQYFTSILEKQILKDDVDIAFITDIRYAEYAKDEVQWVQNKLGGCLVHLERTDINGDLILPPNENEKRNDPILKEMADVNVNWETYYDANDKQFDGKMYRRWLPIIKKIYKRFSLVNNDPAIKQAIDVAQKSMMIKE